MVTSLYVEGRGVACRRTNAVGTGNSQRAEHEPSDDCYGAQSVGQPRRASSSHINLPMRHASRSCTKIDLHLTVYWGIVRERFRECCREIRVWHRRKAAPNTPPPGGHAVPPRRSSPDVRLRLALPQAHSGPTTPATDRPPQPAPGSPPRVVHSLLAPCSDPHRLPPPGTPDQPAALQLLPSPLFHPGCHNPPILPSGPPFGPPEPG